MQRRTWILMAALAAALALAVAGCQQAATPAPAPAATVAAIVQTVVVEKPVEKVVEKVVQQVVTATPAPTAAPKKGGTLVIARAADSKGLDPHKQTAFSSFRFFDLVYNTLVGLDKDLKVVPSLAESWTVSPDGMTVTFKLRPNVKFHNGETLTSDDVKFTFERILNPETAAAARSNFTDIDSITTPDPNTVVFKLKKPNASILASMTTMNASILNRKAATANDPNKEPVVGTGPFKLEKWTPDNSMTLAANKDYFVSGQPLVDKIEVRIIPDEATILAGLRAKNIDWALINDPKVGLLAASSKDLNTVRTPSIAYHVFGLNASRPPFDNPKVRQAIVCAINRQELIDVASLGEGVTTGPLTQPYYALAPGEGTCGKQDVEKAKALLAEAGAKDINFKIMIAQDEPPTAAAEAQAIQAQLKKIGVNAEIESLELANYVKRWLDGDMDAWVGLNGGNPDPDVMLYRYWHSTGNLQKVHGGVKDAELDKLLDQGRATFEPEKRKEIYTQVQKKIMDLAPWAWTYVGYEYRPMQQYVKGFTPMPNGSIQYLREAWLDK